MEAPGGAPVNTPALLMTMSTPGSDENDFEPPYHWSARVLAAAAT